MSGIVFNLRKCRCGYLFVCFNVCDDAQARFLSAFNRYGLSNLGYPISRRYERDGFVTQAFQKAILQWRPDTQSVAFVNVFDDMSWAGLDQRLNETRQTPYPLPAGWDGTNDFATIRSKREELLSTRLAIRSAYFGVASPLDLFGLPTSEVSDMGNHYAIRTQRAVFQEWKETVPWARAGQVTIANGGEIAKEMGLIPASALATENGPMVAAAAPAPAAPAPASANCHPSYPDVCIPGGPDLDCPQIPFRRFRVIPSSQGYDPHGFDGDYNGIGCEH